MDVAQLRPEVLFEGAVVERSLSDRVGGYSEEDCRTQDCLSLLAIASKLRSCIYHVIIYQSIANGHCWYQKTVNLAHNWRFDCGVNCMAVLPHYRDRDVLLSSANNCILELRQRLPSNWPCYCISLWIAAL